MSIHLRVLGVPNLETRNGESIDFPVGKPLALLSYLVVEGKAVARDDLALLLWPDSRPDRARHSVRQAIWLLRRKLGEEVIEGDELVEVSGEILTSDIEVFRKALSDGEIDAARELWRGPFLSRLSLSECRDWEHWREEQREILRLRFFRSLLERARDLKGSGSEEEALHYLDDALRLSPSSSEASVLRIETLLALGRIPAARQALEQAKHAHGDSGAAEDDLAALEATVQATDPGIGAGSAERMGESVEFVGRAEELAELRALWKGVRGGRPGYACILGPTGIGKTRLAEEFLAGAQALGGRVARAKGYRSEHRLPRGTVTDLVRQILGLPGAKGISPGSDAVLRAVLPSLLLKGNGHENGEAEAPEVGEVPPAALADAVADLVEAVGFEVPLVLFLDDWQWVDKESRALLGKVMRRVRGLPCLFLLAERTGERRRQQDRAGSVIRDLGGPQILLGSLTESELGELLGLLAVFTDPEAGDVLVRRIHRVTGGNPLFVGELLRKLGEEGAYRRDGEHWILAVEEVPEGLDLPESVQELIRERLERLTPTAAQVAGALASERRSAPARLLRRRAGLDEAVFTRAVGELVEREVVDWVGAQDLDFAHDQLREAAGLFFGPEGGGRIRRWVKERPGWTGAGLLAGATLVLVAFAGASKAINDTRRATYPFGDGSLFLVGRGSAMEARPPRWEGDGWDLSRPTLPLPRTQFRTTVFGAFRSTDGRLRWFGNSMPPDTTPYALEILEDGSERVLLRTPGDDGFRDISPCGRQALVNTENLATETYDYDLLVVDLETGTSRRIYRAQERITFATWSPDGQRIAAGIRAQSDTLVLLSPQGDVLGRIPFPEYRSLPRAWWCEDSRFLMLQASTGEGNRGLLLDTFDGTRRELDGEFAVNGGPVCLGAGRAAIGVMVEGAGRTLRFFDLLSGESEEIPSPPITELVRPVWVPDHPTPPIHQIRITDADEVLPWGARDTLGTVGTRTDGSTAGVESVWGSSDPGVLSVQPGGILSANKAGRAWVFASYRGWLRDSVEVRVEDSGFSPEDVLFREPFSDPALPEWTRYGNPIPSILRHGEEWVLSIGGDGRYQDGLFTKSTFSLNQGATLELEFRLPLGRTDRQRVEVCLWEDAPGTIDPGGIPTSPLNEFCFGYPSGEQLKFREDLARVRSGPLSGNTEFSAAPALPSDDWVHIALQVRADGTTSVFLNRRLATQPRTRVRLDPGGEWIIRLFGASVDTDLWIRNLTLWRGERFDTNPTPAPSDEFSGLSPNLLPREPPFQKSP